MRAWLLVLAALPLAAQQAAPAAQETPATPVAAPASQAAPVAPVAAPAAQGTPAAPVAAPAAQEAAAAPVVPTPETTVTGSLDLGYRFNSVGGSLDTYRSVVDMGSGVRLLGLDLTIESAARKWFDRIDVRGSGWGGDPYTTAHVDAIRHDWYRFNFDYRDVAYFNFLPSFADPTIGSGIFLDQQSFDSHRRMMDFELELLPGHWIVPYVGYSHDSGYGTGVTDFVNGINSYPVEDRPRDRTDNYRGGVRLELKKFHVTLEQGGTTFKDDQQVFTSAQNLGNNTSTLLGEQLDLTSLTQSYGVRGDSIYSKAVLTANPTSWLDLFGEFLYSRPDTNVNYSQYNVGQFADLTTLLFYTSELDLLNAAAKQPHTTARLGFEIRPTRRLRVIESWTTDRLHNTSSAVLSQQILTPAMTTLLNSFTDLMVMNYNREQVDALFDLTSRITLRGGYRYEWGDGLTDGALISGSPTETGQLRRQVGLGGVSYRAHGGLSLSVDFEGSGGDRAYFRTSLQDYQKARIQARYQVRPSLVFSAGFSVLSNQNPNPAVNYDFLSRDNSASVTWTPNNSKRVTVTGEYTQATLRSNITYIVPQDFTTGDSLYRDNVHEASALVNVVLPGFGANGPRLSAGGSLFRSSGSRPTEFYQPTMRFTTPSYKRMSWYGEWRYEGFSEAFYLYEGFRSQLVTLGMHLTR